MIRWPPGPDLPLRELAQATFAGQGLPGDLVTLALSTSTGYLRLFGEQGVLVVGLPGLVWPEVLGVTDAAGAFSVQLTVPALPVALDGVVVPAQAVFLGIDGATLGTPLILVWVAAGT